MEVNWLAENHDQLFRKLNDIDSDIDKINKSVDQLKEQIDLLVKGQAIIARSQISVQNAVESTQDNVKSILEILQPSQHPVKLEIQFQGEQPGMPGKETDTQTIPCSAIETDAVGNSVTLNPASVTWGIDDPTIATLTQNPDGSATFKALKVGTANVTCTDNSVNPPLVGMDTLTVTAGPGTKLVLQFGTAA
jgi:hypothetical protein